MSLGPLGRLSFFGFICPCHESDDEYLARLALQSLQGKKVAWFRSTSRSISLQYATLHILDRSFGPILQLISNSVSSRCSDEHDEAVEWERYQSLMGTKLYVEIPLYRIDRVECHIDDGEAQHIHFYENDEDGENSQPLLQLSCSDVTDTIEHLAAILRWDRARRADIGGSFGDWEAAHLATEEKALLDEDE
ncbi:hypothetical protein MHU86_22905 [Fragilaria crotonensis]|nr:hypothetical protein MHU86_22905 [Fragilaria crotonensis]